MASEAPIDIKALTASADSLSKALGALFDEETQYLDYLRDGRQRLFFVTAVSDSKVSVLKPVPKEITVEGEKKFNLLKSILCSVAPLKFAALEIASIAAPIIGLAPFVIEQLIQEQPKRGNLEIDVDPNFFQPDTAFEGEDAPEVETKKQAYGGLNIPTFTPIGQKSTAFEPGGVVKGATKSVVAEAGVPEWVVPFVKLGEIIKNTAYNPIGSLMVGAAASLFDILPLGGSQSSLRIAIASLKAQFGMEVFKPEIRGSAGGIAPIKASLRVVNNSFTFFISNFFGAAAAAKSRQTTPDPSDPSGPVVPVNVPAGREAKIKEAFQFYKSKGFSDTGAAYMVGNLLQESQLDPAAIGDGGRAHGLAQWRDDAASGARWLTYLQWAKDNGKEPGDFYAQLEYTIVEGEKYNAGLTMMKGDNKEDHKKFIRGYEGYSEEGNRFGYAEDILQNLTKYTGGPPNNPKTPPGPPNKILSPVEWTQISEKIEKWKKNPGVYTNNKKVQVAGLGTVLVGKEGNWPNQKPVLKYFDPTGKPMTEKEWMDKFNQLGPNQPTTGPQSKGYGQGGPDLSPNQYTPSLNPVTSQKDTMDLNFSVETRDERAAEQTEQNSISFVPIFVPGQVIEQVKMVPVNSMTKKSISYIDTFSHGVKRGSRTVL